MSAPNTTYSSNTELSLGNVPNVDDPILYEELLNIHNAIEYLLDNLDTKIDDYVNKQRAVKAIDSTDSPYSVLATDGLILVDASAGDVTVILYTPNSETVGYLQRIKRTDTSTNTVLLTTAGSEQIDNEDEWEIGYLDTIPVRSDGTNWWIE